MGLEHFKHVWLIDFEFRQPDGEMPEPVCMVAKQFGGGITHRLWRDQVLRLRQAPFSVGSDSLFVAYYAPAELGCLLTLNWPIPERILDLYAEFRCMTSGCFVPSGHGLLGALTYYGIDGIDFTEKTDMRDLAQRGGPYTIAERMALLAYCESDVVGLEKLLDAMRPHIDLPRALLRGRYMAAVARMERQGVPIDTTMFERLCDNRNSIREKLVEDVDQIYGVYEGTTFRRARFEGYLAQNNIAWPRLTSGNLALDDETFKEMSTVHPELQPLRDLRRTLATLKENKLAVGTDGRNRCMLSAYQTKTGRNAPSNSRFVFGLPAWMRSLILPEPGHALVYLDWSAQEIGIAAALSGDPAMLEAYRTDPYLWLAKKGGYVPPDATKRTHPNVRELFKVVYLAANYGMQAPTLAKLVRRRLVDAEELLRLHRQTFPRFWRWSDGAVDYAMLHGSLHTVFGWKVHVGPNANPRSLSNFPMQANGAEIMRLACCLATERGIALCAPVHDALMIEAPIEEIDDVVARCQVCMNEASRVVLDGFELRTDAKIVRYPDRYIDPRSEQMWATVMRILDEMDGGKTSHTRVPGSSAN